MITHARSLRRVRTWLLIAAAAFAWTPASVRAQATVTLPLADNVGYLPSTMVVTAETDVTLVNLDPISSPDGAPHDMRSVRFRSNKNRPWCVNFPGTQKCPLIWSPLISAGEVTTVEGIADLTPGVAYEFFCSYHSTMRGTLTVQA